MINAEERIKKLKETGHFPYYLECPNCGKEGIDDSKDFPLVCLSCKEEFVEDDLCPGCEKLVKGSCYSCKMD